MAWRRGARSTTGLVAAFEGSSAAAGETSRLSNRSAGSTNVVGDPLRKLDGDITGAAQEHQTPIVEIHDLVLRHDALGREPGERGIEVIDRETDVVETEAGQVGFVGILRQGRAVKPQELHFLVRGH